MDVNVTASSKRYCKFYDQIYFPNSVFQYNQTSDFKGEFKLLPESTQHKICRVFLSAFLFSQDLVVVVETITMF